MLRFPYKTYSRQIFWDNIYNFFSHHFVAQPVFSIFCTQNHCPKFHSAAETDIYIYSEWQSKRRKHLSSTMASFLKWDPYKLSSVIPREHFRCVRSARPVIYDLRVLKRIMFKNRIYHRRRPDPFAPLFSDIWITTGRKWPYIDSGRKPHRSVPLSYRMRTKRIRLLRTWNARINPPYPLYNFHIIFVHEYFWKTIHFSISQNVSL